MGDLLLLHGAIGSSAQLRELKQLLNQTHNIHLFDFIGHGGKSIPEKFSIDLFATDLLKYLDEKKLGTIDIFGYSMGGYVALYLAAMHPERIGKIFTLATKFDWTTESAKKEASMLNPIKIEEKVPAFANALSQLHQPQDWKLVLSKTADMMLEMGEKNPLNKIMLSTIQSKVVVCVGDSDKMVSETETLNAANAIPNGTFKLLKDTPHPIDKIDINLLANEINLFLKL